MVQSNCGVLLILEAEKEAARVAAEQVAGVRAFENNVIVQPVCTENLIRID